MSNQVAPATAARGPRPRLRSHRAGGLAVAVLFAACGVGGGSEIGPVLPRLPDESSKVSVFSDEGRAVVGARVLVGGREALTGRNGRGDLLASPRGRVVVDVDASQAAAANGDLLAGFRVATTIAGQDLPAPLYLPSLFAANRRLPIGVQNAAVSLATPAGDSVLVPVGTSVDGAAGAGAVELRLGELARQHLPGDLPLTGGIALLWSRGLFVAPLTATFAPGLTLDVANELGGTASPQLWRLDPESGTWQRVPVVATATATRLRAVAGVPTGGLYAFAVEVPATTVSGRIVDAAAEPMREVLVGVDQAWTRTGDDGRWSLGGVAATRADGSPRQAVLTLAAGGSWLPALSERPIDLVPSATAIGDVSFDTVLGGNVRVQAIVRGRANSFAPIRLGAQDFEIAVTTAANVDGQASLEDLPAGLFGTHDGRPIDSRDVFYGQAAGFLQEGRRRSDFLFFQQRRGWFQGTRRTRAYACDAIAGGPLRNAFVVAGAAPDAGLVGETGDGGQVFAVRQFDGRATVSRRAQRDGRELVHAFSIVAPDGDNLEFPLQRLWREPLGAFDRHGLVAGNLVAAVPARRHALRSTRRLSLQEWWDDVVSGVPIPSSLPIDVDPAITHGPFVAGVDAGGGNLAAIEFTTAGVVDLLQAVAVLADLQPTEAATIQRDLMLLPADTVFDVLGAAASLPPEIDTASLRFDLALRQPSGRVVDVARRLGGAQVQGPDLRLLLPALAGPLTDHEWLVMLRGENAVAGSARAVLGLAVLRAQDSPPLAMPALPTIQSPAANGSVPASGFAVDFTMPAGAIHGLLELRSGAGAEQLIWQVLLPPTANRFEFVRLPVEAPTPLLSGRTYTLSLRTFTDLGILEGSPAPYRDLSAFWQSIGPAERGVRGVAATAITITTF